MNTFRPSGYSKNTATALFSPLLAWYPKILISDPTGRLALVTPFLNRLTGGPPSRPQLVVAPSVPFTSIHTHECGLTSSTFVTVPCRLIGLVSSNAAANEWCALTGTATSRRPTAVTPASKVLVLFISVSSSFQAHTPSSDLAGCCRTPRLYQLSPSRAGALPSVARICAPVTTLMTP